MAMASRSERLLVASAALLSVVCLGATASGYTDDDKPITDDTAYTLPQGKWRLGLFAAEVGLHDRLMASTYHPLWTIGVDNLGLKYKFVDTGRFAFSAASAVTYVTSRILLRDLDPDQAVFDLVVVPVEVTGSARLHRDWTLSFASVITPVILRGNIDTDAIQGAAAVTNLQLHSTLEWRVSKYVHLLLHGRYLVFQSTKVSATLTAQPDPFTTVVASAAAASNLLDFPHAFSVTPSIQLSFAMFNLRLGLGYGNFNVPAVNFMIPQRFVVPDFDFYWAFP